MENFEELINEEPQIVTIPTSTYIDKSNPCATKYEDYED